jgi:hypothetical protein
VVSTKEYPPEDMEAFRRMKAEQKGLGLGLMVRDIVGAARRMPATMRELAVVQVFTWLGLFSMWMFFVPATARHVFGAPTGDFMGLTVFKNGSLARERIRDAYGLTWPEFSRALELTNWVLIGTLLASVAFHEAYHVGQSGILRRVIGREGVLKPPRVPDGQAVTQAMHPRQRSQWRTISSFIGSSSRPLFMR